MQSREDHFRAPRVSVASSCGRREMNRQTRQNHTPGNSLAPSTFRLRRRTPGSFLLVPSVREGRAIRCQGQLEGRVALILSACPAVTSLREQPFPIWYEWDTVTNTVLQVFCRAPEKRRKNGRRRISYTVPDFLVTTLNGTHLIEVKPSHRVPRPETSRKLSAARIHAAASGFQFHVLTEHHVACEPILSNVRVLGRYARLQPDESLVSLIVDELPRDGLQERTLLDRLGEFPETGIRQHVCHLLAAHRISADLMNQPLTSNIPLYPKGVLTWDPFESVWAPNGSPTDGSGGLSGSPRSIP
ncbi:MAG: TnsA endonuclease N-terminal domain-containing protein [Planctomycetota bacterium]